MRIAWKPTVPISQLTQWRQAHKLSWPPVGYNVATFTHSCYKQYVQKFTLLCPASIVWGPNALIADVGLSVCPVHYPKSTMEGLSKAENWHERCPWHGWPMTHLKVKGQTRPIDAVTENQPYRLPPERQDARSSNLVEYTDVWGCFLLTGCTSCQINQSNSSLLNTDRRSVLQTV